MNQIPQFVHTAVAVILFCIALRDAQGLSVNQSGCGDTKYCLRSPDTCNPNGNSSCLFASTSVVSGGSFLKFELRGESDGFIAVGLTNTTAPQSTALFVCAQNNSVLNFSQSLNYSNSQPTVNTQVMTDTQGVVNGSLIICTFRVPVSNISLTNVTVLLGNGTYNGSYFGNLTVVTQNDTDLSKFREKTVQPTTTPAPTTTPTTTVNQSGCGDTKYCLRSPDNCNPNGSSSCLFASTSVVSGGSFLKFELRGESDGYIAVGLNKTTAPQSTALFVCVQNNSVLNYSNSQPTVNTQVISDTQGDVNGSLICTFRVPVSNISPTNVTVLLGNGTYNGSYFGNLTVVTQNDTDLSKFREKTVINRADCAKTKLCIETPNGCDPSGPTSCLFTSVVVVNEFMTTFELRGETAGYIAVGLTNTANETVSTFFVCKYINGVVSFQAAKRNNSMQQNATLTTVDMLPDDFKGEVNGSVVSCIFKVANVTSTTLRHNKPTFKVILGNGTFNGTNLGTFTKSFESLALNLSDPRAVTRGSGVSHTASLFVLILSALLTFTFTN